MLFSDVNLLQRWFPNFFLGQRYFYNNLVDRQLDTADSDRIDFGQLWLLTKRSVPIRSRERYAEQDHHLSSRSVPRVEAATFFHLAKGFSPPPSPTHSPEHHAHHLLFILFCPRNGTGCSVSRFATRLRYLCLSARPIRLQHGLFLGLGLPSHFDPCSLGQTFVCYHFANVEAEIWSAETRQPWGKRTADNKLKSSHTFP